MKTKDELWEEFATNIGNKSFTMHDLVDFFWDAKQKEIDGLSKIIKEKNFIIACLHKEIGEGND